jgi:hypothetical protein
MEAEDDDQYAKLQTNFKKLKIVEKKKRNKEK